MSKTCGYAEQGGARERGRAWAGRAQAPDERAERARVEAQGEGCVVPERARAWGCVGVASLAAMPTDRQAQPQKRG